MKNIHLLVLLLVLITTPAWSQQKRNLTADDFSAIRDVSKPQLSPDGKMVAYVVETDKLKEDDSFTDIYMIPPSGGDEIQLTSDQFDSPHPKSTSPQWSPDNKYLAFLAKRDKKSQVFLMKRSGGVATQLTDVKQDLSSFEWSPDSKKLALVMKDKDPNEPEDSDKDKKKNPLPLVITRIQFKFDTSGYLSELRNHIYVFNLETKEAKQITSGPWDDSNARWSPDGSQVLFVSNRSDNPDTNRNKDLFVAPAAGGEPRKLTTNIGSDEDPDWSPDGKWIAYTTSLHPELLYYDATILAVIPAAGGAPRLLTSELDRNAFRPRFSPDSKRIYFLLEDQGTERLASVSVRGGDVNRRESSENVVADFDVNANGLVYTASRPNIPYEVFAGSLRQKTHSQSTKVNSAILSQLNLGKVEPIQFHSKDGTPVSGF
ncbi:MAG TPA: DPP IV N-terminal domain-containing protein, partial [Acidobacteriota bacterium]|nr:DPP IV N-terminal domain-containing protein [Acidobacteriota bacterium]